ncbi:MAG: hypothetical protein GF308_03385 [Candidatus Heimdallarchaeota archaeon]|nr:hypothetical protein [Candidatus Heimdallarchaeota archaeon]
MEDMAIIGVISKRFGKIIITTEGGEIYNLSAIRPWEAVSPDFNSGKFEKHLGKRVRVSGITDGDTIWNAHIEELDEK